MVSKKLSDELKLILKEEFNLELDQKDLVRFATSLVGYFDLLARIEHRSKYGKS